MPIQSSVTPQGQNALQGMGNAAAGMQRERMLETQLLASRYEQMMNQNHERYLMGENQRFDAQRQEDIQMHEKEMMDTAEKNRRVWHQHLRDQKFHDLKTALDTQNELDRFQMKENLILKTLQGPMFELLKNSESGGPSGGGQPQSQGMPAGQGMGTASSGVIPEDGEIRNDIISRLGPQVWQTIEQYGSSQMGTEFIGSQILADTFAGSFEAAIGSEGMPGQNAAWKVGLQGMGKGTLDALTDTSFFTEFNIGGPVKAFLNKAYPATQDLLYSLGLSDEAGTIDTRSGDELGQIAFNQYRDNLGIKFEQAAADAAADRGKDPALAREMTKLVWSHIQDMLPQEGELSRSRLQKIEGYTKEDGTKVPGVGDQLHKLIQHYRDTNSPDFDAAKASAIESSIQLMGATAEYMSDNINSDGLLVALNSPAGADLSDDERKGLQMQIKFMQNMRSTGTVINTAFHGQYISTSVYENQMKALHDIYESAYSSQDIQMNAMASGGNPDALLETHRTEHPMIIQQMMKDYGVDKITDDKMTAFRRGLYGPGFNGPEEVDAAFDAWRAKADDAMSGWDGKSGLALPPVPYKLKSSVYGSKQAEIWFATKMAGATDRDPSWDEEGVEEMLDTASNTGPRVDEGGNIVN